MFLGYVTEVRSLNAMDPGQMPLMPSFPRLSIPTSMIDKSRTILHLVFSRCSVNVGGVWEIHDVQIDTLHLWSENVVLLLT